MAEDTQDKQNQQDEQQSSSGGGGGSTAVKAAAAAAATSVAAIAAKKALSHRSSSNGGASKGDSDSKGAMSWMLTSALSGGWDAARDALLPAAEDAAGAAGEWVAQNAPEIIRERIVPRFIESFNEAGGGS